jgi:hypothetical protein
LVLQPERKKILSGSANKSAFAGPVHRGIVLKLRAVNEFEDDGFFEPFKQRGDVGKFEIIRHGESVF